MLFNSRGFSLIELLIVLAVMAILINAVSPDFSKQRLKLDIDGVMTDLITAISMTRSSAVTENKIVTFCRSSDGLHCQGSWREGSIIFTDQNADHIVNDEDRILFRLQAIKPDGSISFNSFRNRQYLQMTPRGFTNNQNGNFTYCPANNDAALAQQIILSLSGRTRFAKDSDGDGIVENSRGIPLDCS